jgi:hypothetical protein
MSISFLSRLGEDASRFSLPSDVRDVRDTTAGVRRDQRAPSLPKSSLANLSFRTSRTGNKKCQRRAMRLVSSISTYQQSSCCISIPLASLPKAPSSLDVATKPAANQTTPAPQQLEEPHPHHQSTFITALLATPARLTTSPSTPSQIKNGSKACEPNDRRNSSRAAKPTLTSTPNNTTPHLTDIHITTAQDEAQSCHIPHHHNPHRRPGTDWLWHLLGTNGLQPDARRRDRVRWQ